MNSKPQLMGRPGRDREGQHNFSEQVVKLGPAAELQGWIANIRFYLDSGQIVNKNEKLQIKEVIT